MVGADTGDEPTVLSTEPMGVQTARDLGPTQRRFDCGLDLTKMTGNTRCTDAKLENEAVTIVEEMISQPVDAYAYWICQSAMSSMIMLFAYILAACARCLW